MQTTLLSQWCHTVYLLPDETTFSEWRTIVMQSDTVAFSCGVSDEWVSSLRLGWTNWHHSGGMCVLNMWQGPLWQPHADCECVATEFLWFHVYDCMCGCFSFTVNLKLKLFISHQAITFVCFGTKIHAIMEKKITLLNICMGLTPAT